MDLCRSRRKENRRIEVRAEGSTFVLGVFGAWHNRVVSVFMPPSAEPGMSRLSRSARVFANALERRRRARLVTTV